MHNCEKVREDEKLQKAGVLKHVKEIISKVSQILILNIQMLKCDFQIRSVSDKLGNILEYPQVSIF